MESEMKISLEGIDWTAPWVEMQDELAARYDQAHLDAGRPSPPLDKGVAWADSVIAKRAQAPTS